MKGLSGLGLAGNASTGLRLGTFGQERLGSGQDATSLPLRKFRLTPLQVHRADTYDKKNAKPKAMQV